MLVFSTFTEEIFLSCLVFGVYCWKSLFVYVLTIFFINAIENQSKSYCMHISSALLQNEVKGAGF